ncbi:MFS transporter [Rhodothalassium salexigens]|uniref:peptide MFS transporter n=1 Tax=Rhodothalassium salexigens TaxID=1086 RepID=UPI001911B897|nr:peptide MFS transporter [Rhodothalassium salexigens]MBK5921709.1 MFS transporter [Rhodothalassium salexigens]
MSDAPQPTPASAHGEFLGHPKGLIVLFLTEMWERFSYYGMRALLIFYLTQHFLFGDDKATAIYGAYTALVYVMPVIGGLLADRYLGAKKAVTFGAILLVFGHATMAIEGDASRQFVDYAGQSYEIVTEGRGDAAERFVLVDGERLEAAVGGGEIDFHDADRAAAAGLPAVLTGEDFALRTQRDEGGLQLLYLALALIIAGTGFLKANISTIVGDLYAPGDRRRDSGFTIFYMGINLGSFMATLLCGWLGQTYGWQYGFGLAGIGMVLGLTVFRVWQPLLRGLAEPPDPAKLRERVAPMLNREWLIYLGGVVMVVVAWLLLQSQDVVGNLLIAAGAVVFGGILAYSLIKCTPIERDRMLVATFLILCQIPFWALFEQAGSSLNLFADRAVDRTLFGWEIPASMFQSLNAFFIITLAPLFAIGWTFLARKRREPSTPVKFSLGLLQVGLGFLVLVAGIEASGDVGKASMIWLVLVYLLHTTGELCLSPVGLSMITKLSVARLVGMMMGAWFLATAFANFLAAQIARTTGAETVGGEITDLAAAKANYADVYANVGWLAVAIAVGVFALSPILRRGMHEERVGPVAHNMAGEAELAEPAAAGAPASRAALEGETRSGQN